MSVDHVIPGNTTQFFFHDLHPAYSYDVSITAITVSPGPYSEALTVTMDEDGKVHK